MYDGDVVLLELSESLSFGSTINTACLASDSLAPREICVTVGWGLQNTVEGSVTSNVIKPLYENMHNKKYFR